MARDDVWYVYGIVRDGFDPARAPSGLDDAPIELVKSGRIAALASRMPSSAYGPATIEQNTADVAWLSPRAMAHDRVLTWAQDHGGVIPMPMFSLWRSDAALGKSLTQRATGLAGVFKRVHGADEFGLRVYRRDDAMLATIHEQDKGMAKLRAAAQGASPGQRYLLERKYAEQGKQAVLDASAKAAKHIFTGLKNLSRAAVARPLAEKAKASAAEATLVLNGAFLVDRSKVDAFREAVGAIVRDYQPRGLTFDFTGPWPPYNFVTEKGTKAAKPRKAAKSRKRRT